eukprot:m.115808 g.115808  ORF g.115808 m.115808 type:complete len:672 (+) comp9174_c0_seq7:317-2332(+)
MGGFVLPNCELVTSVTRHCAGSGSRSHCYHHLWAGSIPSEALRSPSLGEPFEGQVAGIDPVCALGKPMEEHAVEIGLDGAPLPGSAEAIKLDQAVATAVEAEASEPENAATIEAITRENEALRLEIVAITEKKVIAEENAAIMQRALTMANQAMEETKQTNEKLNDLKANVDAAIRFSLRNVPPKGQSTLAEYYHRFVEPAITTIPFWLESTETMAAKLSAALRTSVQCPFANPPDGSNGTAYRDYFVITAASLLEASGQLGRSVVDTSTTAYLDGRKPDCTLYNAKYVESEPFAPLLALSAVVVRPVTGRGGTFTAAAIGEALTLGECLLAIKPFATAVTVAVTDCHRIQFFRISRCDWEAENNSKDDQREYACTTTEQLGTTPGDAPHVGLAHLWALLAATPADLEAEVPISGIQLEDFLGAGSYGSVFAGRLSPADAFRSVAVKLFEERRTSWDLECSVLARLPDHPALPKLVNFFENDDVSAHVIVSTPVGKRFDAPPRRTHIRQIVDGLRHVHRSLVHCDIKPGNLVIDALHPDRAIIIDWGSARELSDKPGTFWGTTMFAPLSVLSKLSREFAFVRWTAAMDLESLVLTVLCMASPAVLQAREQLADDNNSKFVEDLRAHWMSLLAWPPARAAYDAACAGRHDELLPLLELLVPPDECLEAVRVT